MSSRLSEHSENLLELSFLFLYAFAPKYTESFVQDLSDKSFQNMKIWNTRIKLINFNLLLYLSKINFFNFQFNLKLKTLETYFLRDGFSIQYFMSCQLDKNFQIGEFKFTCYWTNSKYRDKTEQLWKWTVKIAYKRV